MKSDLCSIHCTCYYCVKSHLGKVRRKVLFSLLSDLNGQCCTKERLLTLKFSPASKLILSSLPLSPSDVSWHHLLHHEARTSNENRGRETFTEWILRVSLSMSVCLSLFSLSLFSILYTSSAFSCYTSVKRERRKSTRWGERQKEIQ